MKKIFLFALLMLSSTLLLGQNAYIEVKGEPDLSVYLNSKFQGKITDDAGIFIIENVTPGKNLIKIVKVGYTPFEETIIVKANEVLAYKVKPFTKHKVYVSEEGNTAETDKKATIKTGKLIVQSVPIEIKITIPDIDGINKSAKTKDKWQADEIPVGNYNITFIYNQKVISKTIEIKGSETTSLFVNMMNGDFKASNTLDERKAKEREDYLKYYAVSHFIDSLSTKYKYKKGMRKSEFRRYNSEADRFMSLLEDYGRQKNFTPDKTYSFSGKEVGSNVSYITFDDQYGLSQYNYDIISGKGKDKGLRAVESYNKIIALIESSIPKEFITKTLSDVKISYPKGPVKIRFSFYQISKNEGEFAIEFTPNYQFNKE